jgi:Sec-independent protein translocase protein TatA
MDSFFGIGLPELVIILLLAGLVMGPHRIRQFARMFGRLTAQFQKVSREFARQLNSELDAVDGGEMKNTLKDMRTLQDEVQALRQELSQVPKTFREQGEAALSVGKAAVKEGEAALDAPVQNKEVDTETADTIEEQRDDAPSVSDVAQPPLPKAIEVPEDPES